MLKRAYLEITNVCNRSCVFCPGCKREKHFLSPNEFTHLAKKLRAHTEYLYLHVMGEPLFHPQFGSLLQIAKELGFKVTITTNGTLLKEKEQALLSACPYKLNISLHSFEANGKREAGYFENCFEVAEKCAAKGTITVLRLWNMDGDLPGLRAQNQEILSLMQEHFAGQWKQNSKGYALGEHLYLEFDKRFIWPAENAPVIREYGRCHALTDQIAVLCDGSVVPCCLDGQGAIVLGNLFTQELSDILSSPRALAMKKGFQCAGRLSEELCKTCGYAARFDRKNNIKK